MAAASPARAAEVLSFPNSEQVLRGILENASIGMSLVDADGTVVYANRSFSEMFGYPMSECIGLKVRDLVDTAMIPGAAVQLEQLIRGEIERYRTERRYRRRDGSLFWGLVSASAIRAKGSPKPLYIIVQITDIDREKSAKAALAESESRWNFALDSAGQGVWDHDLQTGRAFYSRRWRLMRGFAPDEEVDPSTWLERVHPDDRDRILEQVRRQDSGELKYNEFEYRERHRDGHWIWILSRGRPVEWKPDGAVARILGTDTDITSLKEAEARLASEKELLAVTLDSIADGVVSTDASHNIRLMNPAAQLMTGWTDRDARGKPLRVVFNIEEEETGRSAIEPVLAALDGTSGRLMREGSVLVRTSGETMIIRECASVVKRPDGTPVGGVLVFQDITEGHRTRRRLSYSAMHDPLTGLSNRAAFDLALVEALASAREGARQHSLCFMDLDRFKQVNDAAGHAAGDALLKHVAEAIQRSCRSRDLCARIGGDEFALILRDCSPQAARYVADKVVQTIEKIHFAWNGRKFRIGASIGVVPIDSSSTSAATLLEDADAACYAVKRSRQGGRARNRDPGQSSITA